VDALAPLVVALPLLAASVLVGGLTVIPRAAVDAICVAVAVAVAAMAAVLMVRSADGLIVYWFGGWQPRGGVALGISFAIEPIGGALACFVALMFVAAFVFSSRYFVVAGPLFHALMLVFLAGAEGFCLTGDLFNLFVFFELVSVSAYALTAYDIEEEGPLTGTLNFAVTNSVGALLILIGIALVYARTGALNLAQIGDVLAGHAPDGLVIGAFTLMAVGFLTKAAVVPFHFWLADAYSVAPTPVCLLLSAAMSELGLFALARVYWTLFDGTLGASSGPITAVLLIAGAVTAVLGAVVTFAQRHLKRMLAFATISHVGLFLIGIALLDRAGAGLAGTGVYVLADGAVKASLFVGAGVLQHRFGTVDELELRGKGRDLPLTAGLFLVAGLALASFPLFGPFLGKAMIDSAAVESGHAWIAVVIILASGLTGGAVLRATGRIFRGWGRESERGDEYHVRGGEVDPELAYRHDRVPLTMTVPTVALLAFGLALGFVPGLADAARRAGARFVDRPAYAAEVLQGQRPPRALAAAGPGVPSSPAAFRTTRVSGPPLATAAAAAVVRPPRPEPAKPFDGAKLHDWLYAVLSLVLAVGLAFLALTRGRLRELPGSGPAGRALRLTLGWLRSLHTGQVPDYVTWLVAGTVLLGLTWAVTLS
jgi:multicomponent Na+:H+ antiporter subunit D